MTDTEEMGDPESENKRHEQKGTNTEGLAREILV